ncbi:MAG TPA: response regulator [Ktedonobacteraceae bacterium]|nr:response regulator [Ktedonobacteraceae bacterium]
MSERPFSFPADELSAEDLAVIQAFDAIDDLVLSNGMDEQHGLQHNSTGLLLAEGGLDMENPEDMLILFASEVDEDIATMRRALQQVEQDNDGNSPGLISLGRTAHKLKGTSGAMGCEAMSAIALRIEEEIQLIKAEKIEFLTGLMALVHAINALEMTLQSVVNDGQESVLPLQELSQDLEKLDIHIEQHTTSSDEKDSPVLHITPKDLSELSPTTINTQVDTHYLRALMSHTEHLIELHAPLESAQKQVTQSLMELQAAHARLRRLEGLFSSVAFTSAPAPEQGRPTENHPASSLVTRILHEALQRTGRHPQGKTQPAASAIPPARSPEMALWDEMEMDRFTENRILLQSFSEAVADVATASAQLRTAFAQLNSLIEQQIRQATTVRNDALRLRSAPFSILLTRVQRAVQMIAQAHNQPVQFEAAGETTEIDQDILEFLAGPLLHLVRTSVAESLLAAPPAANADTATTQHRIWLQAQLVGSEVSIELGFSMPIPGGALEVLREPVQQLQGSIAARRNSMGGISYQLRFPRAQGVIQGLMVTAGGQGLVFPLPHVHSIDYKRQESYTQLYSVAALLGFPPVPTAMVNALPPVILLAGSYRPVAVQVDEIVGEIELVMKPLPTHLQRPGVVGTVIDGSGNVLLVLDLPSLIQHDTAQRRNHPQRRTASDSSPAQSAESRPPATILVADDSVYMRQSLRSTFERAGYQVIEARDGIEALEYLSSEQSPAVLMLDIEMPNLNGYDLLNILHNQPGLADCKTILLTSRSSEKHRQRAMELGAYDFLSKPCPQEVLLEAVRRALADTQA